MQIENKDLEVIFKRLESIVKNVLDGKRIEERKEIEEIIFTKYEDFRKEFRKRIGTSRGISAIAEYLVFQTVRKLIEKEFDGEFKEQPLKDTSIFELNNIVMTHDINVFKRFKINQEDDWRPDIAILKNLEKEGNNFRFIKNPSRHSELVSVFQIKTTPTGSKPLKTDLKHTNAQAKKFDSPMIFWVLLRKPPKTFWVDLRREKLMDVLSVNTYFIVGESTDKNKETRQITLKKALKMTIESLQRRRTV